MKKKIKSSVKKKHKTLVSLPVLITVTLGTVLAARIGQETVSSMVGSRSCMHRSGARVWWWWWEQGLAPWLGDGCGSSTSAGQWGSCTAVALCSE